MPISDFYSVRLRGHSQRQPIGVNSSELHWRINTIQTRHYCTSKHDTMCFYSQWKQSEVISWWNRLEILFHFLYMGHNGFVWVGDPFYSENPVCFTSFLFREALETEVNCILEHGEGRWLLEVCITVLCVDWMVWFQECEWKRILSSRVKEEPTKPFVSVAKSA